MTPQDHSNHRTLTDLAYQFLLGAALGAVLCLIPWAVAPPTMTMVNIAATAAIVIVCGILSAFFGKRFLTLIMNILESFPPIA